MINKNNMIFKTLVFTFIALISLNNLFSQEKETRLTYKLIYDYSDNFVYNYIYNEKTDIKRVYSDKKKFNFSRDASIYFHYKSSQMTKTGFETIEVVTDSIRHTLDSAKKRKWHFFTKDQNCFDHYNRDVAVYNLNVGRSYKYVISPYYEIADIIPSEVMINDLLTLDSGKAKMKPDKFIMYRNALSKQYLNHFTDVKKIDIPIKRVPKDSVWNSNIEFVINGVQFTDTISVKLVNELGGYYIMESEFNLNQFIKNQTVIYGPSQTISEPMSANLNCKLKISLSTLGKIEETILEANGEISFINRENQSFTDKIDTKISWKADGRYEY